MQGTVALRVLLPLLTIVLAGAAQAPAPTASGKRINITYQDAKPVMDALRAVASDQLRGVPATAAEWPAWVARRDAEIRARIARGDEDSVLNFVLFGTSFTKLPRALNDSARIGGPQRAAEIVRGRIDDACVGIIAPGANERLQFARRVVERAGMNLSSADARIQIARYLRTIMARVVSEVQGYTATLQSARSLDPVDEFIARSKLLQMRGLSSDTSMLPDDGIDEALEALQTAGTLGEGGISRTAIVGPGLDFTDKAEGYDFYPPQTMQPFALVDSLLRLKLAAADALQVTAFDLNPRINEHLEAARMRAVAGESYTLELVRDPGTAWRARVADYWWHFGDRIGEPGTPIQPPEDAGQLAVRAVRVRPAIVLSIVPRDLNIVVQHLDAPEPRYDLIIATNIFLYYGPFEQALALVNVAKMLRPGGVLLSNNALPERLVPWMKSIGSTRVVYSDRADDGDRIVWYRRQ